MKLLKHPIEAQKWDWKTRTYGEPYLIDLDRTPLCSDLDDLDRIVECAQCGRKVMVGDCYTSKEVHNRHGFGFQVCPDCHHAEFERERKYGNTGY